MTVITRRRRKRMEDKKFQKLLEEIMELLDATDVEDNRHAFAEIQRIKAKLEACETKDPRKAMLLDAIETYSDMFGTLGEVEDMVDRAEKAVKAPLN